MSIPVDPEDKLSQIAKKANDTYAKLSNCYLEVENLKLEMKQLHDKLETKACSDSTQSQIDKLKTEFDPLHKKILNLDDHKDMQQALVREIKNGFRSYTDVITSHSSQIDELYSLIEALKSMIASARTDLDVNMHSTVAATKRELHHKIDELPIPRDAVNMPQVRAHVDDAVQSISLDAKNAYLSAQNNEMRLEVMEKKIENILIKIKNVELKTQ